MHSTFNLHDERELNKIGLETYFLDNTNMFDIAIDKLIDELKLGIGKSRNEFDGWHKLHETDPTRYKELEEQAERCDLNIDSQQHDTILDIMYNEEKLLSLVEMKVIYAFKSLEINIKKLLGASFSLSSTKDFHKWENVINFLRDKNIDPKGFKSYYEITQLKAVNNAIKHSNDYETSLNYIPEFKDSDKISYDKVDRFYNRIKKLPNAFLQELVSAIYCELYEFDEKKIEEIARTFVLRMKKSEASILIQKINDLYGSNT